jgi:hypothetical protein
MVKGIKFSSESSNPLSTDTGIWFNSSKELVIQRQGYPAQNVTSALSGGLSSGPYLEVSMLNNSGSTIVKGTPVTLTNAGTLKTVDVSVLSDAYNVVGVAKTDISDSTAGYVIVSGVLDNLTTSLSFGDAVFVSKLGTLTSTLPEVGVDGFTANDFILRVGSIFKNTTTPTQKDLLVNISVIARLG